MRRRAAPPTVTICAEIEVTSSISLDVNWDTLDQNETFYLTGKNTSALLTPNCDT